MENAGKRKRDEDVATLTVPELRDRLKSRKLDHKGRKAELVARLSGALSWTPPLCLANRTH